MATGAFDPSRRHRRREQGLMFLLASPALVVILALVVVPVGWLMGQSFYDHGFTLENYRRIFVEPIYWRSFALTFRFAFEVTLLALLLGYPVAYVASALGRPWDVLIMSLVILPFWTSVLVRAYAWLVLLQRTGVVNHLLASLGLIDEPLALVHNELGTVIATVHILLPFMVLPLYSAMQKIPRDLLQASASLGCGPWFTFTRVFLPLSLPGVSAGLTLVFVLALGFYITPELLGGGRTIMVSMVVSRNVELYDQWGAASAVGVVLLACVLAIFAIVGRALPLDRVLGHR
jgi:putative spermidine/putrescine transport system permease protein